MSEPSLGIDVSKKDLSLTLIINDKSFFLKVDNNNHGFKKICSWLKKYNIKQVKTCLESTGIYSLDIANYLYDQGHRVSIINPACINAFAKSKLSRHKTDKVDSYIIAEYAGKYDLRPYKPADPLMSELRALYNCRINLEKQNRQVQNFLESKTHLPIDVCKIYHKLSKHLINEINKIQQKIDTLISSSEQLSQDIEVMQTVPGIGKKTAVTILAEVPNIRAFNSAREFAAFVGLTPKHHSSGTSISKKSRISKIGSGKLRNALYFPAMSSMRSSPDMIKFAQKLRSKGKNGKVIVVAIMRKLLHLVFGVLKNNSAFKYNFTID